MFEKNLNSIKEKNPILAQEIEKISIDTAKEKISVYEAESKDLILAYDELALDSIYDPIREAKTIWNKNITKEPKKNDIQIVFGLGLGYLFKRVFVSCESKVLLYEPKTEILRFVLEYIDLSNELTDERIFITNKNDEAIDFISKKYLTGDNINLLYSPNYVQLEQEKLVEFSSKVVKVCEEKNVDVTTISVFAKKWALETIFGINYYAKALPLGALKDKYKGKTALIAAPGPSLADDIEEIKKNRSKFLLIALNRSLGVLYENNITPDFVIYFDADGSRISDKLIEEHKDEINLIVSTRTNRNAACIETKNKFIYFSDNDWLGKKFKEECSGFDINKVAGSVSHNAYYVAKSLGCEEIIFSGLDLAFKENQRYANSQDALKREIVIQVKNKDGNIVESKNDYALFARQFEEIIEQEKDENIYNTTSFGIYIKGMNYAPLKEILPKISPQNIQCIDKIKFDKTKQAENWNSFINSLKNTLKQEKEFIEELSIDTENMALKLSRTLDYLKNEDLSDELKNKIIEQNQKSAITIKKIVQSQILFSALQKEILEYTARTSIEDNFSVENIINLKQKELNLYENLNSYSMKIIDEINKVI